MEDRAAFRNVSSGYLKTERIRIEISLGEDVKVGPADRVAVYHEGGNGSLLRMSVFEWVKQNPTASGGTLVVVMDPAKLVHIKASTTDTPHKYCFVYEDYSGQLIVKGAPFFICESEEDLRSLCAADLSSPESSFDLVSFPEGNHDGKWPSDVVRQSAMADWSRGSSGPSSHFPSNSAASSSLGVVSLTTPPSGERQRRESWPVLEILSRDPVPSAPDPIGSSTTFSADDRNGLSNNLSFAGKKKKRMGNACNCFDSPATRTGRDPSPPPEQREAEPAPVEGPQTSQSADSSGIVVPGKSRLAPWFTINLDADAVAVQDRWKEVGLQFSDQIKTTLKAVKEYLPEAVVALADTFEERLDELLPEPYNEELRGLAIAAGVPLGELFLFNLAYDITAHCTSIVAQTKDGHLLHARNRDQPRDPEALKLLALGREMIVVLRFQKGGTTVYSGTTIAGNIGLLTGQKPGSFTLSVDERRTGNIWDNILHLLLDSPGSALMLVTRDALAEPDITFDGAVNMLMCRPLIAAAYFIIGGIKPGEGAVISRTRKEVVQPLDHGLWKLDAQSGTWYLLETNNDHWTAPPDLQPPNAGVDSYERQQAGNAAMNKVTQGGLNPQTLIDVLSTEPVFNEHIVQTTLMSAASASLYTTWVRYGPEKKDE